jgi:hypothetical protein
MNQPTTLYFPDTIDVPEAAARLLLFFDKMYYYLPVESEPVATDEPDPLWAQGLCQGYAPAPIGDDLHRFNRAIRDLQTNLYDYGEKLQQLAAASFITAKKPDHDELSVGSLIAAMSGGPGPKAEKQSQPDDWQQKLWQARIILKLAEGYDREKEEIDARLAILSRSEQEMLDSLKGDDEGERFDEIPLPGPAEGLQPKADPFRQRMRAWTTLFLADAQNDPMKAPCILSTSRRETAVFLLEAYTEHTQRQPGILFSLPVPGRGSLPAEDLIGKRDAFRAEVYEVLGYLQKLLAETAAGTTPCPAGVEEKTIDRARLELWTEALRRHFPDRDSSQGLLTVYCLDNTTLVDFLTATFPPSRQRRTVTDSQSTGLIAYLDMG